MGVIRKMKERIIYLDVIRGIAIILIVLGHMERGLMGTSIAPIYIDKLDMIIYSIHLPILFILSGITEVLGNKSKQENFSMKKYILHNVIALYIPYLIFVYFFWFVKMFIFSGNHETSYQDLYSLLYSGKWVFWFCLSLLIVKIIHALIERYIKCKYINLIFGIIIYVASTYTNIKVIEWLSYGLFYEIGCIIQRKGIINNTNKTTYIVTTLMFALGMILFRWNNLKINMVAVGVSVTILLMLALENAKEQKVLQVCGKYSMVIYLIHTLFTSSMRTVLIKMGIQNFYIIIVGGTTMSIAFSLLIVWIYKNVKYLHFVEYLFYPSKKLKVR